MGSKTTIHNPDGPPTIIDTRTLADAKADALARLKAQFSPDQAAEGSRIDAGFGFAGKIFQIDQGSRLNIVGANSLAMLAGQAGQPFSIGWRAYDNSTKTMDGPTMIAFAVGVGSYYSALFAAYQVHKDQIEALTTIAACDAHDVMTGWPG